MNTPERITKLYRFYQVNNDWDLIDAMSHHIDKLQDKLQQLTIRDVARRIVREG